MGYPLGGTVNGTAEIAASINYPGIRFISSVFSYQNFSQNQQNDNITQLWSVASPQSPLGGFSAVCYLTAKRIYDSLGGKVPLGLIDTSLGGVAAELWLPPRHASGCASFIQQGWTPPWTLSCWWNGMVSPWTSHELAFWIWDQGENNVGSDPATGLNLAYRCLFSLVVNSWREAWRVSAATTPFFFIQLPDYVRENNTDLAATRDAQLWVADTLPNVYYAVTVDDGDAYDGSIHNRNKERVADRMAPTILAKFYGMDVPYLAPRYASATVVVSSGSSPTSSVTVSVKVAPLGPPLTYVAPTFESNSSWCPGDGDQRHILPESCGWFGVQLSDGQWYNASVAVSGDGGAIELTVDGVAQGLVPVATKNGWADWAVVNVYSGTLPVVPWGPTNITVA